MVRIELRPWIIFFAPELKYLLNKDYTPLKKYYHKWKAFTCCIKRTGKSLQINQLEYIVYHV